MDGWHQEMLAADQDTVAASETRGDRENLMRAVTRLKPRCKKPNGDFGRMYDLSAGRVVSTQHGIAEATNHCCMGVIGRRITPG